jgi:hypothetical protein
MFSNKEVDKFIESLGTRILSDAPDMIKYLDSRRVWDENIHEVVGCVNFQEIPGKTFEVKSFEKSDFTPFLDQRIENLKNRQKKEARIITGDGDAWSNDPSNKIRIETYENAVKAGCDIEIMLTELGAWTVKGSARRLHEIGVSVGRVAAKHECHAGVIGDEEMYVIHRYPKEGATKIIGESQKPENVHYTFLCTDFQPFVKSALYHLSVLSEKFTTPYSQVSIDEANAARSREDILRL